MANHNLRISTANPNPVGVNQSVLVVMWLDKIFDPTSNLTNTYRFHNYNLTIIDPNGQVSQQLFDIVQDKTAVQTTSFTPTVVGTYQLQFSSQDKTTPNTDITQPGLIGDYFTASSASTNLTVQKSTPLPSPNHWITSFRSQYRSRPIYGEEGAAGTECFQTG